MPIPAPIKFVYSPGHDFPITQLHRNPLPRLDSAPVGLPTSLCVPLSVCVFFLTRPLTRTQCEHSNLGVFVTELFHERGLLKSSILEQLDSFSLTFSKGGNDVGDARPFPES